MEKYEHFKTLAEKKRLTAQDRAEILDAAEQMGIALNRTCSNCYHDAAVQIALALKPAGEPQTAGAYELYENIDITLESYRFGRLHVCAKECNEANAKLWIAAGIPLRFFKHLPDEGNK